MDESKKNRMLLVAIVVLMLLIIFIVGVLLHLNKDDKKIETLKIRQLYVSDYDLLPFDKYFIGVNGNKIISVIDNDGNELYLNDNGITYEGLFMKDEDTPIFYNVSNDKLNVYTIGKKGPNKLFTINDVSEVIPLVYSNQDDYLIGFVQYKDNDSYIYNFENKGLVVLDGVDLVGDRIVNNSIYTYSKDNIVVKKDDLYGSFDIDGNNKLEVKYDDLINGGDKIIFSLKHKYGIMDKDNKVLIKNKYNIIKYVAGGYLIGNDKLSFYDENLKIIVSKKIAHNIIDYSLREDASLYGYKMDSKYLIINNYLEDSLDKDYKNHNMYIVKDKKISNLKEIGFGIENVIYSYDENSISIYSTDLANDLKINASIKKIKDIVKIQNDMYYVITKGKDYIFDKEGKKVKNIWGKLLYHDKDFLVYYNDNKLNFINYDDEVLETFDGSDIIIKDKRMIVNNNIYAIES